MRATGSLRAVPPTALLALACAVLVGAAFCATDATASRAAAKGPQKFTLYSVTQVEQFLDHSDDRTRGKGNNPFGNFKDSKTVTKEAGNGPFAGDNAVFSFQLYTSPDRKTSVGSAIFTCTYNFNRHAFCDASYQLDGGLLLGAGAFDFNAGTFSVAITGGTGKYAAASGDILATPAAKHSQRLAFVID